MELGLTKGMLIDDGRFELQSKIGTGAYGMVWSAVVKTDSLSEAPIGTIVAIKFLLPGTNQETTRGRFHKEALNTFHLKNPHIPEVFRFFMDPIENHPPYIAMEYLEGKTLGALVNECGPLNRQGIITLLNQCSCALEAVHTCPVEINGNKVVGFMVRDLHPGNIFVTFKNKKLHFYMLDFGSHLPATGITQWFTEPGKRIGVRPFMSPEALDEDIDKSSLDGRVDIYSLAAVAYYAATGTEPFSSNKKELERNKLKPPPEVKKWPEKDRLRNLIKQMMDPDPDKRPNSAAELGRHFWELADSKHGLWNPPASTIRAPVTGEWEVGNSQTPADSGHTDIDEPSGNLHTGDSKSLHPGLIILLLLVSGIFLFSHSGYMNLFEIDRINELAGRAWQTWMQKNQPDGKAIAGDIIPGSDSSSQIITNDIVESVEVFGDVSKDEPDNGKYHDNELDYTFLDFVYGNLISNMASSTSAPEVHSRPEKKYLSSKPSSRMATASSSAVASRPGETRLLKRAQPRGSLDDSVNALKTTGPETGKTNVHGEKISTKIEARPRSTVLRPVSIAKETDVDAAGTSLKMELTEVKDKLDLEGPRNDGQRQWAVDHNERLGGRLDTELENL